MDNKKTSEKDRTLLFLLWSLQKSWESGDCIAFRELVDTKKIAARLDEINQQTRTLTERIAK